MQRSITLTTSLRFYLSARGHSTEAAYRLQRVITSEPIRRKGLDCAQAEWALRHGLEPVDGAYLSELRITALTKKELGEALAIFGQTREMVSLTIDRLVTRGFVHELELGQSQRIGPSFAKAQSELATAELELDAISQTIEANPQGEQHLIGSSLRQAISRVIVARRYLEGLSGLG